MTEDRYLGKIADIDLRDWDGQLGIYINLHGSVGTCTLLGGVPEWYERSSFTPTERIMILGRAVDEIYRHMKKAKVTRLQDLKNKPVEMIFENHVLKSWRILEEVL